MPAGFPFASTVVGPSNSKAPRAAPTVRSPARISLGPAACSRRAAVFTASPLTKELPSRGLPTTTSPVFTPIRRRSSSPNSSCCERGMESSLCMVLLCGGCAEGSHHGVAGELLDRSAGALNLRCHGVVELIEQGSCVFRILLSERGRVDEIGEHEGHDLSLLRQPVPDRRATVRAIPQGLAAFVPALGTDVH